MYSTWPSWQEPYRETWKAQWYWKMQLKAWSMAHWSGISAYITNYIEMPHMHRARQTYQPLLKRHPEWPLGRNCCWLFHPWQLIFTNLGHLIKYPFLFQMPHKTTEATQCKFLHIFSQYRLSRCLYTNTCFPFNSEAFAEFPQPSISPLYPQSNSSIKRQIKTITSTLTKDKIHGDLFALYPYTSSWFGLGCSHFGLLGSESISY